MSSRYRGHKGSIQLFSRQEKEIFHIIADLIRALIYIVTGICKGIYELSKYIRKIIINQRALNKIGYSLTDITNLINNKISPRQFEVLVAELFKNTGEYDKVEVTSETCDYGRDVILTRKINGFKEITFVEVKHYSKDNMVGREICQKLLGACQMLGADKAIVVTTGKYHKNAYEVEHMVNNLKLMDSYDIEKMILDLKPEKISRVIMRTLNAS